MTTNDDQNPTTSGLPSYGSVPPPPEGSYPPPPPPSGPAPVPGASGFSATEAVSYGLKKFGENAGPILIATVLLIVAAIATDFLARALTGTDFTDNSFSIGGSISTIITNVVGFVIGAGVTRGALDITEGHKFDIVAAFKKLNIVNVIVTSLVVAVLTALGFALLIIPGIIVAFLTLFAIYFVVDKDTNAIDSIKGSLNLVKNNVGNTIVLILLSILVVIVGFLALCVGVLVAIPVLAIAWAYTFKVFLGEPVAP
ncbi:hypothetical protein [Aeromicrobium sp.]|uniref:hypothetical protein n=1 Tax=Aeromicrobium sp. TaxID=1871063 RepID=UPI002FCC283F